ncbi:hypothetical protein BJ973_009279 [Actinoplanes tereljensis]|uniref:IPT/TIG domain-containing protein n=1 Tax=Paractinoplanes tereljensis TaxID=571912 RepID=A0A919NGV7_9ACTN|nr:IPT/TIG domain-containing protein [Actinoplanes tereljensis]GIF17756.1 hypothetical protein Ate02nite_04860 [Actinoplanes tereljensis]
MRKSKSFARSRLAVAAGLSTGAVAAALLVAPTVAFAAVSINKSVAAPTDVVTVTDTTASPFTATTSVIELQTTTCNAKYQTPTTAILAPAISSPGSQTTSVVSFVVPAAAAGTNGQLKKWNICVYGGTVAGTSPLQNLVTSGSAANNWTLLVGYVPTTTPTFGLTGGGDTIKITPQDGQAIFTGVTTVGAAFTASADCPSTYTATPANLTATVTKSTTDNTATLTTPAGLASTTGAMSAYQLCLYNGAATSSALISQATFNVGQLALSQTTGPWGGLNGLNITSPNQFLAGNDTPGVIFNSAACAGTYSTQAVQAAGTTNASSNIGAVSVSTANTRKVTDSRLAVTVPALFATAPFGGNSTWNLCVYADQGSGALIASAPYTLTTVPSTSAVSPKAGPALGGSKIVVTGTALPTDGSMLTATLGGVALTNIVVLSSTAFSAVTPQHAPANNVALVITTAAGSHTLPGAYTFTPALKVAPNTAPSNKAVDIVVNGVGFQSANWQTSLLTGSHIVLVRGTYDPSTVSANRANPPIAECGNVLVLSDNEAICKLDLTKRLKADGSDYLAASAPATVTGTGSTTAGSRVLTDTAGTGFTQDMVGTNVTDAAGNVPAGTTVVRYISAGTVLMSANATGTLATGDVTFSPNLVRTGFTVTTTATSSPNFTVSAGLLASDVDKLLVATGLTADKISSYTSSTAGALTSNASAIVTAAAGSIYQSSLPVPEGAYNLIYVSNTAVGANGSDATYQQSSISSASTFTVSSF